MRTIARDRGRRIRKTRDTLTCASETKTETGNGGHRKSGMSRNNGQKRKAKPRRRRLCRRGRDTKRRIYPRNISFTEHKCKPERWSSRCHQRGRVQIIGAIHMRDMPRRSVSRKYKYDNDGLWTHISFQLLAQKLAHKKPLPPVSMGVGRDSPETPCIQYTDTRER